MATQDSTPTNLPPPARAAVALENDDRLDAVVTKASQVFAPLRESAAGSALRGEWAGHAIHPALTDLPIGMFTATAVLDLFGGEASRPAAQKLIGAGLLGALPTAITGWAEWTRADHRAQRVGVAHAALNVASLGFYAGSWLARRSDRHRLGAALAMAGSGLSGTAAYLGGHLAAARAVSSRHPAFASESEGSDFITSSGGAYNTSPTGPIP